MVRRCKGGVKRRWRDDPPRHPGLDPASITSPRLWMRDQVRHDEIRGVNRLTFYPLPHSCAASRATLEILRNRTMKIRNSLKSLKDRHRDNRVIRRRGRTYVINKTNRRFKARQG